MTDLGLSLLDLLAYAEAVATFVVEQGVRFCFPLGPSTAGRKRIELVRNTKMGLFTVGGALWRRIEGAGLDPRAILLSSEEKFNASSLFSAHSIAGMFLWWKIWKKEKYAAAEKKRDVYVTVVSAGRASRRHVSLPVQHVSPCVTTAAHPSRALAYRAGLRLCPSIRSSRTRTSWSCPRCTRRRASTSASAPCPPFFFPSTT